MATDRILLGKAPADSTTVLNAEFNGSIDAEFLPFSGAIATTSDSYLIITRSGAGLNYIHFGHTSSLDFSGSTFNKVRVKIRKRQHGAIGTWTGTLHWMNTNASDGNSWTPLSPLTVFAEPNWVADNSLGDVPGYSEMVADMSGVTGWEGQTITRCAIGLENTGTVGDIWHIDSISIDDGGNKYYHRSLESGFFVSKPSQNVMSAADGNLLIDTSDGFFQILKSGEARIPTASGSNIGQEGSLAIQTTVESPHADDSPVMVGWNILVESANANPALGGTLYGGTENDSIKAISNFSSIGTQFIDDISQWELSGFNANREENLFNINKQNRVIPQIGLACIANTSNKQIILEFKNGSTVNTQLVYWKLYRERGVA